MRAEAQRLDGLLDETFEDALGLDDGQRHFVHRQLASTGGWTGSRWWRKTPPGDAA